ncbi:MAG: CoA transferase [Pseudomonadota bacterium]
MRQRFQDIDDSLNLVGPSTAPLRHRGEGGLPSWFDVTGLAFASIGAACREVSAWMANGDAQPAVSIDPACASWWFGMTLRPDGWELPPIWDAIAGVYQTRDGWIRLHTNAPHHRAAALRVLDCAAEKPLVAKEVARWSAKELEAAIVAESGCAAEMRSLAEWADHPQGAAVAREPLIDWHSFEMVDASPAAIDPKRPLAGIRVLDLTRVLAGPVATRFLAGWGADVLRIDPPGWAEANIEPEITIGKHCATLDLKTASGLSELKRRLADADIMIHGYRPGALDALGLDGETRRTHAPGLIDISLCAYGWTGPWAARRGFDSLVQMSSGIAHAGMVASGNAHPTPLPVQALDHATGYLMAAAAVHGLRARRDAGLASSARVSLARVAHLLAGTLGDDLPSPLRDESSVDVSAEVEDTSWGPGQRLRFPARIGDLSAHWPIPAGRLHRHPAKWAAT